MPENIDRYLSSEKKNMDDIGVHIHRGVINSDFHMHSHNFSEIFIIVSGTATHVIGQWEYPIKRGDVYAIKGNVRHGFRNVKNLDIINLMYKPSFFSNASSDIRSIPGFVPFFLLEPEVSAKIDRGNALTLNDDALEYVCMVASFIISQQCRDMPSVYPLIRMNFLALASYLATQYDVSGSLTSRVSALSYAIAYMEQNLSRPIRINDIAANVYLSTRQLERLFSEHFRMSPMKYLRDLRLKNAIVLLTQTDCSVSEAAHTSGFDDVSYFIRLFKSEYGTTPNEARKIINKNNSL